MSTRSASKFHTVRIRIHRQAIVFPWRQSGEESAPRRGTKPKGIWRSVVDICQGFADYTEFAVDVDDWRTGEDPDVTVPLVYCRGFVVPHAHGVGDPSETSVAGDWRVPGDSPMKGTSVVILVLLWISRD